MWEWTKNALIKAADILIMLARVAVPVVALYLYFQFSSWLAKSCSSESEMTPYEEEKFEEHIERDAPEYNY